jgi:hypothetical protein
MADPRKRQRQQQRQFDKFYESFSNCDEMLRATQKGMLSTDRKFTRKVKQQQAEEEEARQREAQRAEERAFLATCAFAGVEPTPAPSSPARKPKTPKKSLKERRQEQQQADQIAELLRKRQAVLPWPFDALLRLQNYDGRWLDPEQVCLCLAVPHAEYFTNGALCRERHSHPETLTHRDTHTERERERGVVYGRGAPGPHVCCSALLSRSFISS